MKLTINYGNTTLTSSDINELIEYLRWKGVHKDALKEILNGFSVLLLVPDRLGTKGYVDGIHYIFEKNQATE